MLAWLHWPTGRHHSVGLLVTATVLGMTLHLLLLHSNLRQQPQVPGLRGRLLAGSSFFSQPVTARSSIVETDAPEQTAPPTATDPVRLLDWTVYAQYPDLLPPFILPGPADLPIATTGYLEAQAEKAEVQRMKEEGARALKSQSAEEPQLWADQDERAIGLWWRLRDIGCKESKLGRPNQACQLLCPRGYEEAIRVCREHPYCTHVIFSTKPNKKREKWATLKQLVDERDLNSEMNRRSEKTEETRRQCLDLGREVLSMPEEESLITAFDEEREETSAMTRRREGTLLFAHIQKAAGTTLCSIMKQNHLVVPGLPDDRRIARKETTGIAGKNCNPILSDLVPAWYGSVETQVSYAQSQRLQMYANEKFLARDLPWGTFSFVTALRNPFERLLSHYHGFGPVVKDFDSLRFHTVSGLSSYLRESEPNFMTRRLCAFPPPAYEQVDGMDRNTSSLDGGRTTTSPPLLPPSSVRAGPSDFVEGEFAALTAEDNLACAKERLRRFNLVLTSDTLSLSSHLLESELGISAPPSSSRPDSSFVLEVGPDLTYESLVALRARHALDLELFAYATALTCRRLAIEEDRKKQAQQDQEETEVAS